jgi:hypothetical protein
MFANRFLMNLVLAMTVVFSGHQLMANDRWHHLQLKSQDGVAIIIDSQFVGGIYEPSVHQRYDLVDNLWINVHGNQSGLTPRDRVDAKVYNFRRPHHAGPNEGWELEVSVFIRLQWNGSNFTGQWVGIDSFGSTTTLMPIASEGALGNYEYRQEVVLTVYKDNSLYRLMDPISNSPYFKFSLGSLIAR